MGIIDEIQEYFEQKRRETLSANVNAIKIVLPFFLLALCIMFFVFSVQNFSEAKMFSEKQKQNEAITDIINNPGVAWNIFKETWQQKTKWNEMQESGENVIIEWQERGVSIDWKYMTNVFNSIWGEKTLEKYEHSLLNKIEKDFYNYNISIDQSNRHKTIAIILLILGIVLGLFLFIMICFKLTFIGMFF